MKTFTATIFAICFAFATMIPNIAQAASKQESYSLTQNYDSTQKHSVTSSTQSVADVPKIASFWFGVIGGLILVISGTAIIIIFG